MCDELLACSCRFGAGWWCLIDALVYSRVVLNENYPFTYNLPGIVATVALVMMNLVSRDDLANMADTYSSEEGSEVRIRADLPHCPPNVRTCVEIKPVMLHASRFLNLSGLLQGRAKLWLFLSYCIAFGAVAGRHMPEKSYAQTMIDQACHLHCAQEAFVIHTAQV